MRKLLPYLLNPCVLTVALIFAASAVYELGGYGRTVGTLLFAAALWCPGLLIAGGCVTECPAAKESVSSLWDEIDLPPKHDARQPLWKQPFHLGPVATSLLCGLGGIVIGCTVPIYLKEISPGSLLSWGGGYGMLGLVVGMTMRLADKRHPHHARFMMSVSHLWRLFIVVFFAWGLWQTLPRSLSFCIVGGLCGAALFTMGFVWSLALLGIAAIRSLQARAGIMDTA